MTRNHFRLAPAVVAILGGIFVSLTICKIDRTLSAAYDITFEHSQLLINKGQSAVLEVKFTSRSHHLDIAFSQGFPDGSFKTEVKDAGGRPLSEKRDAGFGSFTDIVIKPHETYVESLNLSERYDLVPGTYSITVSPISEVNGIYIPQLLLGAFHGVSGTGTVTVMP